MGDTPSWPSWLAFFEAAIKLARSEENKHRLCEDKDSSTPLSLLTLTKAVGKLGCSEKTLLRHIKQKKIRAVKRSFRGRRQWTIEPHDLNRYQMSKWVERHVDYRLTLDELCKEENLACATVYPFGPWEAKLPTFTLQVSLALFATY